jgi:signal transduction histidine kinase
MATEAAAPRATARREPRFYNWRAVSYFAVGFVLAALALPVALSDRTGGPRLHESVEAAATALALVVALMALVRYYTHRSETFLLVGIGFLGAGLLDGYHLFAAGGWLATADHDSLTLWTWTASRFFLAVMLSVAFLAGRRQAAGIGLEERTVYAASTAFLLGCLIVLAVVQLPTPFFAPTLLARPQELVPALLFAAALGTFLSTGRWQWDDFEHWLVLSLIVAVVLQSFYAPFSQALFDAPFNAAHMMKLLSYALVLVGLLANMSRLFQQAERASELLAEQNEELIRSNRELEQFSYAISHDLQEPLRVISGYTQLLGRRYRGSLDRDADEFIDFTVEATERMRDHINGLLEYSRVDRAARQIEQVDLGETLRRALLTLERMVAESGAQVTHDPLPRVRGNPRLLERLFVNLIGNAIKYRSEAAPRIWISAQAAGAHWELRFRDNGIGIDPEYHERVFALFQRLHTREEYAGSGIGLAICRRIVEAHGGTIQVDSQLGDGSTFRVTLPRTVPRRTHGEAGDVA